MNVTIHTVLFTVTVRAEVFRQKARKNNILRKSWTGKFSPKLEQLELQFPAQYRGQPIRNSEN